MWLKVCACIVAMVVESDPHTCCTTHSDLIAWEDPEFPYLHQVYPAQSLKG